jgi:hypothetical protein
MRTPPTKIKLVSSPSQGSSQDSSEATDDFSECFGTFFFGVAADTAD